LVVGDQLLHGRGAILRSANKNVKGLCGFVTALI